MSLLWYQNLLEKDCVFILVDIQNVFNEENWKSMLWAVRNDWPSVVQFTFNCYRHWATLVVRDLEGSDNFLYSTEGVTQGDPLAMIDYGVGLLLLIREFRYVYPCVTHPWYAYKAGAGGSFCDILAHLQDLQGRGSPRGYLPERTKSILVVAPWNVVRGETLLRDMGMKVVTVSRYLGGFIIDQVAKEKWMKEKVE